MTTFAQRVQLPKVQAAIKRAQLIVVEGGVNDSMSCDGSTLEQGTDTTFSTIKNLNPRAKVVVMAPWGVATKTAPYKSLNIGVIRAGAQRYGFTYVVASLRKDRTRDGSHPNRRGAIYLATKLVRTTSGLQVRVAAVDVAWVDHLGRDWAQS